MRMPGSTGKHLYGSTPTNSSLHQKGRAYCVITIYFVVELFVAPPVSLYSSICFESVKTYPQTAQARTHRSVLPEKKGAKHTLPS